jgi:hypothetical protein
LQVILPRGVRMCKCIETELLLCCSNGWVQESHGAAQVKPKVSDVYVIISIRAKCAQSAAYMCECELHCLYACLSVYAVMTHDGREDRATRSYKHGCMHAYIYGNAAHVMLQKYTFLQVQCV